MGHLQRWGVICLVNLALGDLMLVGALFVPWAVLTSRTSGLPPTQSASPFAIL